jgi:hypothetical protein
MTFDFIGKEISTNKLDIFIYNSRCRFLKKGLQNGLKWPGGA